MENDRFGEFILDRLKMLKMNQADLSRKAHLTTAQISRLISGVSNPSIESINSIAVALQVDPMELFVIAGIIEKPRAITDPLELELLSVTKDLTSNQISEVIKFARAYAAFNRSTSSKK